MLALAFAFSACLLDGDSARTDAGYAQLRVRLAPNNSALLKSLSADTTFHLDSLKIILSAQGSATQTFSYALSGRPDTGAITIAAKMFALAPLRTWTARILTLDTLAAGGVDTVHDDSVSFTVYAGDTSYVNKTVGAAFAILRARFLSVNADSIPNGLLRLRLFVDNVVRDSLDLGTQGSLGGNTMNATHFASASTGWAVGVGGQIYKTTDTGSTWTAQNSGVAHDLKSVWFTASSTLGWAAGAGGTILKTTDGANWSAKRSGTTRTLNRIQMASATVGYAAGDSGLVLKTFDGGESWHTWSGGWFASDSGAPANALNDVYFPTVNTGYAAGAAGKIVKTTNSGWTWSEQDSESAQNLNALYFRNDSGYVVGDSGAVRTTLNGGALWTTRTSGTARALRSVHFSGTLAGWAVGDTETIAKTTNAGVTWSAPAQGWQPKNSGVGGSLNGVYFLGAQAWAVGDSGAMIRSNDSGNTWMTEASGAGFENLQETHFVSAATGVFVGNGGTIRRTIDTGNTWTTVLSGTAANINGLWFRTASDGCAAGDSGKVLHSGDGGATWTLETRTTNGRNFLDVTCLSSRTWAVGEGGTLHRRVNTNWDTLPTGTTNDLRGIYFTGTSSGWVVGTGGLIKKCSNSSNTDWSVQATPTTRTLNAIYMFDGNTGYVVGDSGTVLKTTNAGANWTLQATGTTRNLRHIYAGSGSSVFIVGDGGVVLITSNGGSTPSGSTTFRNYRGVHFTAAATGYIVGDSGLVLKTTNTGTSWVAQSSGTTKHLNAVHFFSAAVGWAVGNDGVIRFGNGTTWVTQSSPTSEDLVSVRSQSASLAYAVGKNGTILKTTNGGTLWVVQSSGTGEALDGVYVPNADTAFAVGANGTILKTRNAGIIQTTPSRSLNGLYFTHIDTGYVVGDSGKAFKTMNGRTWTALTGVSANPLRSVHARRDTAWAVGDAGTIATLHPRASAASWTNRTSVSGTTRNLKSIWLSSTRAHVVGDSGTIRLAAVPTSWSGVTSGTDSLRSAHFVAATPGVVVGSSGSAHRTLNGTSWTVLHSGAGMKTFDRLLTYKRLPAGVSSSVVLQALDRLSPERGYKATLSVNIGAGVDSTITSGMVRCGYGGATPSCSP